MDLVNCFYDDFECMVCLLFCEFAHGSVFSCAVWSLGDKKLHQMSGSRTDETQWLKTQKDLKTAGKFGYSYCRRVFGSLLLKGDEKRPSRVWYVIGEDATLPDGPRTILAPITRFHVNIILFLDWLRELHTLDGVFENWMSRFFLPSVQ